MHDAAAGAILSTALCPPGKDGANHSIGKGTSRFL